MTDKQELLAARIAAALAIVGAGYLGINPPGFVAQVVAFASVWLQPPSSQRSSLASSIRR